MTGAGASTVAYALEDEFGDGPGVGEDWIQPGKNIQVTNLSIDNTLTRSRDPDDPRPTGSREGNFQGTASVQFDLTDDNFHNLVFADDGMALPSEPMLAPTATWWFGADLVDGSNTSIAAVGAAVTDAEISYQEGENITVELTIEFADVDESVEEPSEIVRPSNADIYTHHGTDLDVDGTGQSMLQSASISLSNLARMRQQQDRHPHSALVSALEPSFTSDAIFSEPDQLELAYGGSTPSDTVDPVDGAITFENGEGETIGYQLVGLQPQTYAWNALVEPETDLTEDVDYHVSTVEVAE